MSVKHLGALAALLAILVLLPSCGAKPSESSSSGAEALSLSVTLENGEKIEGLSLRYGEAVTLAHQSQPEGEITIASDSPAVSVANKGGSLILNADEPGSAQVTVTAKKEGYQDASFQFAVTVTPAPVGLSLEETTLTLAKGQTATASRLEHDAGALTLSYDENALTVQLVPTVMTTGAPGGAYDLSVTAKEPGQHTVTVTCDGQNYQTETVTLLVTVSQ